MRAFHCVMGAASMIVAGACITGAALAFALGRDDAWFGVALAAGNVVFGGAMLKLSLR